MAARETNGTGVTVDFGQPNITNHTQHGGPDKNIPDVRFLFPVGISFL